MRLPRQPTAVVFDMDGLLFDTESIYERAALLAAAEFGCEARWNCSTCSTRSACRSHRHVVVTGDRPPPSGGARHGRSLPPAGMMTIMIPALIPATDEIQGLCTLVVDDLHAVRLLLQTGRQ